MSYLASKMQDCQKGTNFGQVSLNGISMVYRINDVMRVNDTASICKVGE